MILLLPCFAVSQGDIGAIKKEATRLFEDENYTAAYKLYSQLVANYPKDPEYNYKLGVCMIFAEPDKKKNLPYLLFAKRNANDETKDVAFWLGKANHINYLFDEAIKNYEEFKQSAPSSRQKKLQVDLEIQACNNGKSLLSNLTDLEVSAKKELNEADYFRTYDLRTIGGKLLVKPDEFKSAVDKKKKDHSIVYLPASGNRVYYSSYGDDPVNGRDIYFSVKMADGSYSKGEKVKGINTPFDEDYPFLHPNGQSLYFASKGHNSMGGYDIFRATYNESTDSWSAPVNLEFPINSPDDDYLFVTDSLEKTAWFSTGRQSPPGKTDVLKINTERRPIDVLVIGGSVLSGGEDQSRKSVINVKKADGESITRTYKADDNGDYSLEAPNGAKLIFTVETPGMKTQSKEVEMPLATTSRPMRQTIGYEKGELVITNYFDEAPKSDDYLQYLKVIEKKAKLDVNEGQNVLSASATGPEKSPHQKSNAPQLIDQSVPETAVGTATKSGMDNKQLAAIAKKDAQDLQDEASRLKQDARDAVEVGTKEKEDAERKLIDADSQLRNAESIGNADEKKQAIDAANKLKQEAENEAALAEKILAFGKSLEEDAAIKQQEAQLNDSYAKELDKAISSKNTSTTTTAKLEELQKQIAALSEQNNRSDELLNSIRDEIDQKEKRIKTLEQANANTQLSLTEIRTQIGENDAELEKTRKKKDKEVIAAQTDELKAEQSEKETLITKNEEEIKRIGMELDALKNEAELTNKIKTENIAPAIAPATLVAVASKTTSEVKADKQKGQTVAGNNKAVTKKQTPPVATAKNDALPDYTPLSANNYSEAVTRLEKLDQQLNNSVASDRELFDYNGYQSPQAQAIRTEADTKINEATLRQKELKETISGSKEELKTTPAPAENKMTPAAISKEADDLAILAQSRRSEAAGKEGPAKDSLLAEARHLDAKAEEKYLQAAAVTGNDNKAVFDNNTGNIQKLADQNKASEFDLATAKKLNDEAAVSFKQAVAIREEAASLSNNGAKLGSYSNAEEIEASAIAKQNEAIALLRKTSPDLPLSEAMTSSSQPTAAAPGAEAIASGLAKVNSGVDELAIAKLQSYQKLFEANTAEIEQLNANITANQSVLDKTPGLKSEYAASTAKLRTASELKQKSDASATSGDKLDNLGQAIRKQTEVLKQLSKVNAALDKIVATNSAVAVQNNTTATPPTATVETTSEPTGNAIPTVTETVASTTSDNSATKPAGAEVIVPSSLSGSDTTSAQLLSYLEKNPAAMKNAQAEGAVKKAVEDIKATGDELARIDEKIQNYQPGTATTNAETSSQLKGRADALLVEAETLSGKAFETRKSAEEKSGAEKDSLIALADRNDKQSEDKKFEASALTLEANNTDYENNRAAISELLIRLKNDDPVKAAELEAKNNESETLRTQTKQLREEANSMNSAPARLGALSNAEEKEAEMTQKQAAILDELKKTYPDYVPKSAPTLETPESLQAQKTQLLEKQTTDLTNLINSYNLEYESGKGTVASELDNEQMQLKENAEALSSESKNLLIKATTEPNGAEKVKLLTLAAKTANAAVTQLNKLPAQKAVAARDDKALKAIGDGLNGNNRNRRNNNRTPKEPAVAATNQNASAGPRNRNTVRIEGLEVLKGNAYNDDRPIPVDAKMEDGLVFRVQIGAFRTRLPNNTFRGLTPLNGETTASGYIRYTAGNFNKVENANAVKNDLRKLGYSDAFVVVYYNGRRITLAEALEIMSKEGKTIDTGAPDSAGITASANIPKATSQPIIVPPTAQDKVVVAQELERINGLLFTVQIGVYTKEVTSSRLLDLKPIFTEKLNNGLLRYTAGIYSDAERLISDKNKVVLFGVKDAFVSAYLNGKRIPFSEGKTRQAEDSTVKTLPEEPIVFPSLTVENNSTSEPPAATPTVQPFRNEVTSYPAATDSNGVKSTEEGITFKVQIGAYSKQVPEDVALKFSAIRTWPVENKQIKGLFVYNIGNFSAPSFAKALKDEVVKIGITDAFITVYRNGVKLYGTEAASLMSR